jgi:VanZ family protein
MGPHRLANSASISDVRTRGLLLALAAYVLALAAIALWTSPVDQGVNVPNLPVIRWVKSALGLTNQQVYTLTEVSANVVLFIPLGVFTVLLLRQRSWWRAGLVACGVSAAIETVQAVARPARFATVTDVVANTAGGILGALLCFAVCRRLEVRRDHRGH